MPKVWRVILFAAGLKIQIPHSFKLLACALLILPHFAPHLFTHLWKGADITRIAIEQYEKPVVGPKGI